MNKLQKDIIFCIENKRQLGMNYHNEAHGVRIIYPVTLGIIKGTGNIGVSAYVLSGASYSLKYPQWRLFRLDSIFGHYIMDDQFSVPLGYRRNARMFDEIIIQL